MLPFSRIIPPLLSISLVILYAHIHSLSILSFLFTPAFCVYSGTHFIGGTILAIIHWISVKHKQKHQHQHDETDSAIATSPNNRKQVQNGIHQNGIHHKTDSTSPSTIVDPTTFPWHLYQEAIEQSIYNHITYLIPITRIFTSLYTPSLISFFSFSMFLRYIAYTYFASICYYWIHRILHHPTMYSRFHKFHHQHTHPIPFTSAYLHPVEFSWVLCNIYGWMCFCQFPINAIYLTSFVVPFLALMDHTDYSYLTRNTHHHTHHEKFSKNYGDVEQYDIDFGTDFRSPIQYVIPTNIYIKYFVWTVGSAMVGLLSQ